VTRLNGAPKAGSPRHAALPRRVRTLAASLRCAGPRHLTPCCLCPAKICRPRASICATCPAHGAARKVSSAHSEKCVPCPVLIWWLTPGLAGGLVGREDVQASLARIDLVPPATLMDEVWARLGAPGEKVSIWTVLSKLPAPRAGAVFACLRTRHPCASLLVCLTGLLLTLLEMGNPPPCGETQQAGRWSSCWSVLQT
jgi:hypothetical protein